jgi:cytochrome bd-type quinol oxidase subunit 1
LGYLDPGKVVGVSALVGGLLLIVIVWGFYLRRHGRLRNLQGAAVLAGFAIFMGFAAMSIGAFFILRAAGT